MQPFVVHGVPGSPYVRSVLLGLEEKGLDWRLAPLAPFESRSPEHLARHPFGRVPVIDHGTFRLYETQAILRYIDRLQPEPPLTPRGIEQEARMNQICGITDWYLMPDLSAGICFGRVIAPKLGLPVDEARIAASVPKAKIVVDELARLLGDAAFLAGDDLSIADLMVAPHVDFFLMTPESEGLLAGHDRLRRWMDRMQARPSMQATSWAALTSRLAA